MALSKWTVLCKYYPYDSRIFLPYPTETLYPLNTTVPFFLPLSL